VILSAFDVGLEEGKGGKKKGVNLVEVLGGRWDGRGEKKESRG